MLFRRFYDENLAQASYMVACETTREALIVDPSIDRLQYESAAADARVRIAHVTETHIHADFVSGSFELAAATGARLYLSAAGGEPWGYSREALGRATPLQDGSEISIGRIRIAARHTPGHTPEHITLLVTDLERGSDPVGALTGDFLFVGDVGRPDLLEKAVGAQGSMRSSAAELFRSLQKFRMLPDHLQLWPGHGPGSACGKSLGSMPQSTLGYEKMFNWALADMAEEEFVERVLADQPVPPRYFAVMKRINRDGEPLPVATPPAEGAFADLEEKLRGNAVVVDTRTAERFAEAHIPGTLNIPLNKSFLTWVGALLSPDREVFVIASDVTPESIASLALDLRKIGFTRCKAYFPDKVVREWKAKHGDAATVKQIQPEALAAQHTGRVQVVDVRAPYEWRAGHLPDAIHIPLAALPDRLGELDASRPTVVHCKGGGRSAIAASFLQANGVVDVANLAGGYDAWREDGLPVEVPGGEAR